MWRWGLSPLLSRPHQKRELGAARAKGESVLVKMDGWKNSATGGASCWRLPWLKLKGPSSPLAWSMRASCTIFSFRRSRWSWGMTFSTTTRPSR